MPSTILEIRDLRTYYYDKKVVLKAVDGVNLNLERGEVLGIVGESGCGKSTLGMSILNLVPHPGSIESGEVIFEGKNLLKMSNKELRNIRGRKISMIFQDAVAGLNPVLTIGQQVEEIIEIHTGASQREARRKAIELMTTMGLSDAARVAERFPFQLSGGMAQRVMIAIATALEPDILIADEPTSALDMTVQAQILQELRRLQNRGVSIILITHDLGVIAQMADRVAVMYAGRIAEEGSVDTIFKKPRHPYTWGLLESLPRLNDQGRRLRQIGGRPPDLSKLPPQCAFVPRCPKVVNECRTLDSPPLERVEPGHYVACYNPMYHPEEDSEAAED
jgi:peptide/nickel transport system ATP-binding protein